MKGNLCVAAEDIYLAFPAEHGVKNISLGGD
jgi:hypothetical protein